MLNILSYNIRSFRKNSDAFLPIIESSTPQVLILSETWFTDSFQPPINNYIGYHTIRSERQSGGVSVYIGDSLHSRKIPQLSFINNNIEICTVEITLNNEAIFIMGIYRPHSGTIEAFTGELAGVLQNSLLRNRRCCITGDLNINLLQENIHNTQFVDTMQSHHYFPVITRPTRFPSNDDHLPSLLDHIWCNSLNIFNSGILSFDITDHCPIYLQIPLPCSEKENDEYVKITFSS